MVPKVLGGIEDRELARKGYHLPQFATATCFLLSPASLWPTLTSSRPSPALLRQSRESRSYSTLGARVPSGQPPASGARSSGRDLQGAPARLDRCPCSAKLW